LHFGLGMNLYLSFWSTNTKRKTMAGRGMSIEFTHLEIHGPHRLLVF
jgi:hypothetical protein